MSPLARQDDFAIDAFVRQQESKSLLRFIACGSVDHGKSSLLGRLLYEAKLVLEDQLDTLAADTQRHNSEDELDFSLLLDGLAAEREQKITIDVAYRFFSTPKRKFIVIDAPGHEQYTRNMATGASTADVALILVNAQAGLTAQTKRHTHIVSMLGVRRLVVAINKMDVVGWSEETFKAVEKQFRDFARDLDIEDIVFIPTSAKRGDNVVNRSPNMPWYRGQSLLDYLEQVEIPQPSAQQPFRMPVQWVNRPNQDFRGYSGLITGGEIRTGDAVRLQPSGRLSRIARIVTADGDRQRAVAGQAVTLTLADNVDASRGDVIADAARPPLVSNRLRARIFWMDADKSAPGKRYLIKTGTAVASATFGDGLRVIDIDSNAERPAQELSPNAIAHCELQIDRAIAVDRYADNRETGSFILIDPETNDTVGMGLIEGAAGATVQMIEGATRRIGISARKHAVTFLNTRKPHKRFLAKAVSWRVIGSLATFGIAFVLTNNVVLAGSITAAEIAAKIIFYYVHERVWSGVAWGRR